MDTSPPYHSQPITEALIQFQVEPGRSFDPVELRLENEPELRDYDRIDLVEAVSSQMQLDPSGVGVDVPRGFQSWRRVHEMGRQSLQLSANVLTFSRLAPYPGWEAFLGEAQRLFGIFCRHVQPSRIHHVAVRYINRLDLPGKQVELGKYLRTRPDIAAELPQSLESYFLQLRFPYASADAHCLINQTIVAPQQPDSVSVVLDIELVRQLESSPADPRIWALIETLHVAKNQVFEACITDSARSLFSSCPS